MSRQRLDPASSTDPITPAIIGFRLDPASNRALAKRAQHLGVSPHDLARHYVVTLLHEQEERAALHRSFEQMLQGVDQFRSDFAFAVEAILTSAGKVTKDDARSWVKKCFSKE